MIICTLHLLADAEGENASVYGINFNVHTGSSISSAVGFSLWRLTRD
jgi:hypothetical protein